MKEKSISHVSALSKQISSETKAEDVLEEK